MKLFSFIGVFLFPLYLIGQTGFGDQQLIASNAGNFVANPSDIVIGDVNSDGFNDIIVGGYPDGGVAWFENAEGLGFNINKNIIEDSIDVINIAIADLDGDGDNDIVVAQETTFGLLWYENIDGLGNFAAHNIHNDLFIQVEIVDLNGDSALDIVGIVSSGLKWFENLGGTGNFGDAQSIFSGGPSIEKANFADFDGDGDLDIVYSRMVYGAIGWIENLNGLGTDWDIEVIDGLHSNTVIAGGMDIDEDGDVDIVGARQLEWGDEWELVWYENEDGQANFGDASIIHTANYNISYIDLGYLDGDNDLDIIGLVGDEGAIIWYENLDNTSSFAASSAIISSVNFNRHFQLGELNGDDFNDIVFITNGWQEVAWKTQLDGQADFGDRILLSEPWYVELTAAADLNQDGHLDIINAGEYIEWHKNLNEDSSFSSQYIFSGYLNVLTIDIEDLNGDGWLDICWASEELGQAGWFENLGNENFGDRQIIAELEEGYNQIKTADLDNDNDMDFLMMSHYGNLISWYENVGGNGEFTGPYHITGSVLQPNIMKVVDLDMDGDLDIVVSSNAENKIVWHENLDGNGDFSSANTIVDVVIGQHILQVADIDTDGDWDICLAYGLNGKIVWYENLDGNGVFGNEKIITPETGGITDMRTSDIDNDGDIDLLAAIVGGEMLIWYENLDAQGMYSEALLIQDQLTKVRSLTTANLDSKGIDDVLYAFGNTGGVAWHENFLGYPVLTGGVFFDQNENQIFDTNEINLLNFPVELSPIEEHSYTDSEGFYTFYVSNGNYMLNVIPLENWVTTTEEAYELSVQDTTFEQLNFGFVPETEVELVETIVTSAPTRCGFEVPLWICYQNTGTVYSSGAIGFELDSLVNLISVHPAPDSTYGNIVFWYYENLPPTYGGKIEMQLQMPGVEFIGTLLEFTAITFAEGETGTYNILHEHKYVSLLNCAYDPNDKIVQPIGIDEEQYTLWGEELLYTIRFQNTGTDTAFNIRIRDQLDENLDWTTFHPMASSHEYLVRTYEGGIVDFLFEDILLPDSTINEPKSHGFVTFRIQTKDGLPENTEIYNTASIFFDYNPPIITNTTLNTFVSQLPTKVYDQQNEVFLKIYPNPFRERVNIKIEGITQNEEVMINIYDSNDRLVKSMPSKKHLHTTFEAEHLPSGFYWFKITDRQGKLLANGKLIKQ